MKSNLVRLSGLAAMLGGVLGIVLTPILTHLWAKYSDVGCLADEGSTGKPTRTIAEKLLRSRFPTRTVVHFRLSHYLSRSSTHCEGGNYRIIITTEREELGIQPDVVARRQGQLASVR